MKLHKQDVIDRMREAHVACELITLPEGISSDVAHHMAFHGRSVKYALATMIYSTENGFVAVQRRGDTRVSSKKLRDFLGVKRLRLASDEELQEMGYTAGMVPMAGFEVPFYVDSKVMELGEAYSGLGDNEHGVRIVPQDFYTVFEPVFGNFTDYIEDLHVKRVLSGMRATGRLHLGNYLGAAKGYLELSNKGEYETFYMVADAHAVTTPFKPEELRESRVNVIMDYLAVGLDPKKSVLFIQSMVPEHFELAHYFSAVMSIARMQHLPTFKDKVKQYSDAASMALLNYPILMAADILVYKAGLVPVGVDQEPHLEVAREIARKMNETYGMDFPEPKRFATKGEYVPSLLGSGKMSKSVEGSYISLTDDLATIQKKLSGAPTDSGKGDRVPAEGGVANLLQFVELFRGEDKRREYESMYVTDGIRYGDLKKELAEAIFEELKPIQEKRAELEKNPDYVQKVIEDGAAKARVVAQATLTEVKQKMGLL